MKRIILNCLILALLPLIGKAQFEEVNVPLSDIAKKGRLVVDIKKGPIKIVGSARKDILVKYRNANGEKLGFKEAGGGLKRISGGYAGVEISEKNNTVYVNSNNWNKALELQIEVPQKIDLKIGSYNQGDVDVKNIEGEVSLKSFNGSIQALDISGTIIVSTYSGDITVTLNSFTPDTPMSFTTYAGDIDLTFPSNIKANFKMHTEMGDVYTGFDMNLSQPELKTEKNKGGILQRTFVDEWITGKVNGGGPDFTMKNYTGDIYIRKQ